MFKNMILYRINGEAPQSAAALDAAMQDNTFSHCGMTQPMSCGWVPARGNDGGPLVESIGGQWLVKMMIETKMLPAAVVKRRVDELAKTVETLTGRKPGKKQRNELKDQAVMDLLPQAFTKLSTVMAWIDPKDRLIAIDTSSGSKADTVAGALVLAAPMMNLSMLNVKASPSGSMGAWLINNEGPAGFTIDNAGAMAQPTEDKPAVSYKGYSMYADEIRTQVQQGFIPTKLAMTWAEKVSFVLTDGLKLACLEFLGGVKSAAGADDAFDADAAIMTGELSKLIPDLIEALGGESVFPIEAAAKAPETEVSA